MSRRQSKRKEAVGKEEKENEEAEIEKRRRKWRSKLNRI